MGINSNNWNRIRYTFYTPIYDWVAGVFAESRKDSLHSLKLRPGDKVLINGAGTGLDLEFLSNNYEVTATDITPAMVHKIKQRNRKLKRNLKALVMDGQALNFEDESFDFVVLHLILAVIPDPIACIKETERVLKKGGEVAIFDKFVPKDAKVSLFRKVVNMITNFLFSDITRDIETIIKDTSFVILSDKGADFKGNFRKIKLIKPEDK